MLSKLIFRDDVTMVYCAVLLMATGFALIVSSLFIDSDTRSVFSASDRYLPDDDSFGDAPEHFNKNEDLPDVTTPPVSSGSRFNESYAGEPDAGTVDDYVDSALFETQSRLEDVAFDEAGILAEMDHLESEFDSAVEGPAGEVAADECGAVLYEDTANIIDFGTTVQRIDPDFSGYSGLKRIGAGAIELKKEGVNFYMQKKFYRIDFYKIERITIGDNYVALFLKGSKVARLFLLDEMNPRTLDLKQGFRDVLDGTEKDVLQV